MRVPFLNKSVAVGIDIIEEQGVKKPDVAWVRTIQSELVLKANKESTPIAAEIAANFHPQPLDTGIVGRAGKMR